MGVEGYTEGEAKFRVSGRAVFILMGRRVRLMGRGVLLLAHLGEGGLLLAHLVGNRPPARMRSDGRVRQQSDRGLMPPLLAEIIIIIRGAK